MGRIQMIECLKILLVLFLDMGDGEEVDGYSCVAYRSGSTDTRAGNVVGVGSQSFLVEDVIESKNSLVIPEAANREISAEVVIKRMLESL